MATPAGTNWLSSCKPACRTQELAEDQAAVIWLLGAARSGEPYSIRGHFLTVARDTVEAVFRDSQEAYGRAYEAPDREGWSGHPLPPLFDSFRSQLLTQSPVPHILDLGCGRGIKASKMAAGGLRVTGLEYCGTGVSSWFDLAAMTLGLNFVRADGRAMPFADNSFDGCFDYQCFAAMPIAFWTVVMAELKRVLRPNALFLTNFPSLISAEFHGVEVVGANDFVELILEAPPPHLEWERGLLCVFADLGATLECLSTHFECVEFVEHQHPSDANRTLFTVSLRLNK